MSDLRQKIKIKDNVDLKELKKYGFEINNYICNYKQFQFNQYEYEHLIVDINTREIWISKGEIWQKDFTNSLIKFYELIVKGLVEVVKDA